MRVNKPDHTENHSEEQERTNPESPQRRVLAPSFDRSLRIQTETPSANIR